MKTFRRIGVGITTYLAILRRQIAKLSGRRLARFLQRLRERSLTGEWKYTVEAVREGRVIGRRSGVGLNTNNLGQFLAAIISISNTGPTTVSMTATNGTSYSLIFYNGSPLFSRGTSPAFVQLGTGTTAASRSDYNLTTPIPGTSGLSFSFINNANSFAQSASITYSTAQTPSELGLFVGWQNTSSTVETFMLDHAVFTALPAATTFTVSYSVSLS